MAFKSSKGELKIEKILKENKISFKREVSFSDLKSLNGNPLRFDFIVYKNNRIFCAIEFDGEPHFKYIPYFHKNIFGFKKAREWDRRKNAYCLKKRIPLIRVPYWDLDRLTFKSLFSTPTYLVTNKYHNDYLINGGE